MIGAFRQCRPDRVQHTHFCIRSLNHGVNKLRCELRLRENAFCLAFGDFLTNFLQPCRTRLAFGAHSNGTGSAHPVMIFEILVGVVKDDEGLTFDWIEVFLQIGIQLSQPLF